MNNAFIIGTWFFKREMRNVKGWRSALLLTESPSLLVVGGIFLFNLAANDWIGTAARGESKGRFLLLSLFIRLAVGIGTEPRRPYQDTYTRSVEWNERMGKLKDNLTVDLICKSWFRVNSIINIRMWLRREQSEGGYLSMYVYELI